MNKDWTSYIEKNHALMIQLRYHPKKEMNAFLGITERIMDIEKEAIPIKRKLFNAGVSLYANIVRHGYHDHEVKGELFLFQDATNWYFMTKNYLKDSNSVKDITERAEQVNKAFGNESILSDLYNSVLKRTKKEREISKYGLGFIDIVRKTKHPLKYQFEHTEQAHPTCYVLATIKRESKQQLY